MQKFGKNIKYKGELLDIGSGSGILGLLLAKKFNKIVLNQVELQEIFQFFHKKMHLQIVLFQKMHKGSFLELEFETKFDFCVSNPPFIMAML